MDLSMILNSSADDASYDDPPASPVPASSRWSVDEMQSAVAILHDFPQPPAPDAENLAHRRRDYDLSRLDLLFQADAMIQKRDSPPPSVTSAHRQSQPRKPRGGHRPMPLEEMDDEVDEPSAAPPVAATAAAPTATRPALPYLRSGVWTRAEEEYAAALIFYFLRGALPIPEGTTLRKYLAEQLCCNRRRVSMKLATEAIADKKIPRKVGASVFVSLKPPLTRDERQEVDDTLTRLRVECFRGVHGASDELLEAAAAMTPLLPSPTDGPASARDQLSPLVLAKEPRVSPNRLHTPVSVASSTAAACRTSPQRRGPSRSSPSPQHFAEKQQQTRPSTTITKRSPPQIRRRRPMIIRTGFDSEAEEQYVVAMVECFLEGTLDLAEETRLVAYLSEQLECSAKALSMKLAPRRLGEHRFPDNIGTITFTRKADDASSEVFEAEARVFELRQAWLQSRETRLEPTPTSSEDEADDGVNSPQRSTPKRKRSKSSASLSDSRSPSLRADTSPTHQGSGGKFEGSSRSYSRSGPWSRQEEEYAAFLIDAFFRGVLDIAEGTTLRAFLTSRLGCNPMRISKKLASENIANVRIPKKLGSATYVRREAVSVEERMDVEERIRALEATYHHSQEAIGDKLLRDDREVADRRQGDHGHHHHSYDEDLEPVLSSGETSPYKLRRIVVAEHSPSSRHPRPVIDAGLSMRYQSVA